MNGNSELHTFRGRTMQEAVARLKAKLGLDAAIVKTNRGEDARGRYVEIVALAPEREDEPEPAPAVPPRGGYASIDDEAPPAQGGRPGASAAYARVARAATAAPTPTPKPAPAPAAKAASNRWGALTEAAPPPPRNANDFAERAALLARQIAAPAATPAPSPVATPVPAPGEALRQELSALREAVERLSRQAPGGDGLVAELAALKALVAAQFETRRADAVPLGARVLRDRLVAVGVNPLHAADVTRRAAPALEKGTPDDATVLGLIGRELTRDLPCSGDLLPAPGQRRVLAFVGPTGVGKTTTIAKIAAQAQLVRKLRVGLVTVDTFRMAAVEQLARYADILECPLQVVKSPEALPEALDALADCDLVLVDTTGRSPRAADQVGALTQYFPAGWGGEVVLTLAASTRERDLHAAVDAFAELDHGYLCVTKLDETDALGAVYSLARRAGRPLCWLTEGQRVPEDLEVADAATLAARIVARSADARTLAESLAS